MPDGAAAAGAGDRTGLVVGLGNPGPQYELTYHNLGFLVVDRLAERHGIRVNRKECMALMGQGRIQGRPVVLAKPQTFMNLSGPSVKGLLAKYELEPSDLLLIYDELAIPWNSIRIRERGSAGGHNGVKSVIGSLRTDEFPRVRLGIQPDHPLQDAAGYVLAPIARARHKELDLLLDTASEAVEFLFAEGVTKAMTKYNRRAQGLTSEE